MASDAPPPDLPPVHPFVDAFPGILQRTGPPIFRLVEMCRSAAVELLRAENLLDDETSTVLAVVAERGRTALDPSERVEYRIGHRVDLRESLRTAATAWAQTIAPRVRVDDATADDMANRNITGPELLDVLGRPDLTTDDGMLHRVRPGRPTRLDLRITGSEPPVELVAGVTSGGRRLVIGVDEHDPAAGDRPTWVVKWAAEPKSQAFAKLEVDTLEPAIPQGPLGELSNPDSIIHLLQDGAIRACMERLDMLLDDPATSLRTSRLLVDHLASTGFASAGLRSGVALAKRFDIDDFEILAHRPGRTRSRLQSLDVLLNGDRTNRRSVEWVHRALRDGRDPSQSRQAADNVERLSGRY